MPESRSPAVQLGKVTSVDPRQIWPSEPDDFTPWLAENIGELSGALGIQIDVKETEMKVGAYVLDIYAVAKENPDTVIVIENQLDKTDHGHLGQLLAYAAGLDAKVVVWVAPEIRDEHRTTIEWLNQKTTETVKLFLVRVEVVRIDNSLPAVRFEVEVAPSEFERALESIKPKAPAIAPKLVLWADLPNAPEIVSTWKDVFQKSLERAVNEGHIASNLPVRSDAVSDNFRSAVSLPISGQTVFVDSHGSAGEMRKRAANVLKAIGKPSKFMRIECEDGSVFELPP